jgi:hypothetical protein
MAIARMKNSDLYVILTNRKRAAVALAHSIVFLLIALRGLVIGRSLAPIWLQQADRQSSFGILLVYLVVSTVLIQLARMSGTARERMYFFFCGSSATVGTLRNIVGDPIPHLGLLLRVVMLLCAVATGVIILRIHSSRVPQENQC